jgi:hypothetical protein
VGYRYRSQAILEDQATPLAQEGSEEGAHTLLSGVPGTRVPHLWVERKGQRISTLDLFDGRCVLLTGQDGFPWYEAASVVEASLGIRIAAYRIGSDGDLFDRENGVLARLGIGTDGAMVIRPDGFVAWRANTLTTAPQSLLEQVLKRVLCWSPDPAHLEASRSF